MTRQESFNPNLALDAMNRSVALNKIIKITSDE